jgi:hypothetical protein
MCADYRGKLQDKKPKHIPIHIVSFGHGIAYGESIFRQHSQDNTYAIAGGTNALSDALQNGKTNVVLLNVAPEDYERFLLENAAGIAACNPLLVAPDHHSEAIPKSVIAKYNIQLVPMGLEDRPLSDMPAVVEDLLQQRAASHGGPAGPK